MSIGVVLEVRIWFDYLAFQVDESQFSCIVVGEMACGMFCLLEYHKISSKNSGEMVEYILPFKTSS